VLLLGGVLAAAGIRVFTYRPIGECRSTDDCDPGKVCTAMRGGVRRDYSLWAWFPHFESAFGCAAQSFPRVPRGPAASRKHEHGEPPRCL
jgi:hypothetical protein